MTMFEFIKALLDDKSITSRMRGGVNTPVINADFVMDHMSADQQYTRKQVTDGLRTKGAKALINGFKLKGRRVP